MYSLLKCNFLIIFYPVLSSQFKYGFFYILHYHALLVILICLRVLNSYFILTCTFFLQTHKLSNWLFTWMTLLDCTALVLDVWEMSMKHWNYNDMGNKGTKKLCPRSLVTVTNHYCDKLKHENSCHIFQNTYSHNQATHAEYHA